MVGCGPAPAGIGQGAAKRIKSVAAIGRWIRGVASRATASALSSQRIGDLIAFVAKVEDVSIPVRRDPRPVVNKLRGGDERPRSFQSHITEAVNLPAGKGVVGHIGVHKVEMIGVVQGHVALVAEFVLLNAERSQSLDIEPGLPAVGRDPVP